MTLIEEKLDRIEQLLMEQNLTKKDVLNMKEAAQYIDLSLSHLYKLTSSKDIPHYCPGGKRLYFNRLELDSWLQSNRQVGHNEIDGTAADYVLTKPAPSI